MDKKSPHHQPINRRRFARGGFALLGLPLLPLGPAAAALDNEAAWEALAKPGAVALMRHALAPGTSDPHEFTLDDCSTQRLLNERGREQARATGAALRAQGIEVSRVLSSAWCRCTETAAHLKLGPVEVFEPLNLFFRERERGPEQTRTVQDFLAHWPKTGILVMVTHQVNIRGLTGRSTASGEVIVARPDGTGTLEVLGTIGPF